MIPRRVEWPGRIPFAWSAAAEKNADDGRRWLAGRLKGRGVHGGIAAPVQDYASGPTYLSLYSAYSGEAKQVIAARGPELAYALRPFMKKRSHLGFVQSQRRRIGPHRT